MRQKEKKQLLFLCTGNYYRSRFAEILFNDVANKFGLPWRACSKGLALERGVNNVGPMAAVAINELEDKGIHAKEEFARLPEMVTLDDLEKADRIIALKEAEHLPLLEERFPTFAEKVEFWHIDDAPNVLPLIEQEVMGLVARLLGGKPQDIPEATSKPAVKQTDSPKKMTARVGRETKGRRGKGVTTIFDLPLDRRFPQLRNHLTILNRIQHLRDGSLITKFDMCVVQPGDR